MAGLLDFIKTPEGQGLLSAAFAGIAGAQRGTPWNNAGRAGVAGLMGYQGTIDRQQAEEKNALFNEQARLQMDELKRKNTDAQRTRDILKEIYGQQGLPQSPVSQGATGQTPSLLRLDAATPWGTPQTGSAGYAPPAAQKANGIPAKSSQYDSYKGVADKLAAQGLIEQAQQYYGMAEKFRPKYSTTPQKMTVGGKLMNVLVSEDGSVKTLDGYDVPPEMVSTDLGGKVVWNDKNAIQPGQAFGKTMTPGESANFGLSKQRLHLDVQRGKQQYDPERGGIVDMQTGEFRPVTQSGAPIGAKDKALTDAQAKAALFGTRMQESDKIINDLHTKGRTVSVPGSRSGYGIGGTITAIDSAEGQMLDQSKRDFVNAVLRRESGAVISPSEFDNADKQYFPQIGDSKEVIAQKARNRQIAMRGVLAEVPENKRGVIGQIAAPTGIPSMDAIEAEIRRRQGGR